MSEPTNKRSNWYFPPDMAVLLGVYLILPIAMLSHWFFTYLSRGRHHGDMTLFWFSAMFGAAGTALLFVARFPLYRERRFFVIGPRALDAKHRRLYWWAYRFVGASVLLMILLLLMLR